MDVRLMHGVIALLAFLVLLVAWLALEVRKLHASIAPVTDSSLVRGIVGFGDSL